MNARTQKNQIHLITILGPTATGKTRLAAVLAAKINGEIISADSRQVYRGMNLGTGKDYEDYHVEGTVIPYHLVDIVDPGVEYNVFRFQQDFTRAFNGIRQRGKMPVLCGGSGLYLESVLGGYRMEQVPVNSDIRSSLSEKTQDELVEHLHSLKLLHNITDTTDRERTLRAIEIATFENERKTMLHLPELKSLIIGVAYDRSLLRQRITERLKERLKVGMVAEVRDLLHGGISAAALDFYGLEYRYITRYVAGQISYDEMFRLLNTAIHQFARRQMTWFRRMERKGFIIHWLPGEWETGKKVQSILQLIENEIPT